MKNVFDPSQACRRARLANSCVRAAVLCPNGLLHHAGSVVAAQRVRTL